MQTETELQIALELARRAAVRSGVKGDDAIIASVLADPAVVALLDRPDVERFLLLQGIKCKVAEILAEQEAAAGGG